MPAKTIPTVLQQGDWKKKKGLIATAAVTTGITAELVTLRTLWIKVDWDALDPDVAMRKQGGKDLDIDRLDGLFKTAMQEAKDVQAVRNQLLQVEITARDAVGKYKAAKIHIPDSSKKHVKAIENEAKRLSNELDDIDEEWKQYRQMKLLRIREVRKLVGVNVQKVETGLKAVLSTPTKKVWMDDLHDAIRGLGAQVAIQPDLKPKYQPRFYDYTADGFVSDMHYDSKQAEKEDIRAKYRLVSDLLEEVENDL